MNKNETKKATLIYCGKEFSHYTMQGTPVHRFIFIDEDYVFFEFYDTDNWGVAIFFNRCKNGTKVNIEWKYYGKSNRKIIVNAKNIPSYTGRHY